MFVACLCVPPETAINIGYSCRLLTDEMEEIYVVDGETWEDVEKQLTDARDEMHKIMRQQRPPQQGGVEFVGVERNPRMDIPNSGRPGEPGEFGGFAIVINGHSLVGVKYSAVMYDCYRMH